MCIRDSSDIDSALNIVSRDTDLVQSPLEPLDDAGGGGAGLAGVPLSVCGRQVCIEHSVYNQRL